MSRPASEERCRRSTREHTIGYAPSRRRWGLLSWAWAMLHHSIPTTSSFIHRDASPSSARCTRPSAATRPPPGSSRASSDEHRGDADAMAAPEPSPTSPAHSLHRLVSQNRLAARRNRDGRHGGAIPLAGVHDALSAKIFARHGAPALFLSGFGVSASLLGMPDAGTTNLVEMEMVTRHVCSAVRGSSERSEYAAEIGVTGRVTIDGKSRPPPIIVDGDTGYGGAPNVLRTVSALGDAGAAAITIEDQAFPKKCTVAAGSGIRIVDRDEAVARVRGALGARDSYNRRRGRSPWAGPWIVARTDCRMAYGFDEALERCLRFEELGAEVIYAENLQSVEEYERLRSALDRSTVTMIAQVQETTDKPLLTTKEIGELGYDLALFGVTPLQCVVGALEATAIEFFRRDETGAMVGTGIIGDGKGPDSSRIAVSDFATLKGVVGFDELADFETEFPCS